MASGIISIVLSIIVFISAIAMMNISSAFQQTVQYLMYVCCTILFVGGFILLKLNKISNKLDDFDIKSLQLSNKTKKLQLSNKLKEKFESLTDEEERRSIAYELVELGEVSYKKYIR
jgi:hypothetical protein